MTARRDQSQRRAAFIAISPTRLGPLSSADTLASTWSTSAAPPTAISNSRLHSIRDGRVTFSYKDYRNGGEHRETSLDGVEFLRRLLLHVLPDHFVRIRYYGLLANAQRSRNLERCRILLQVPSPEQPDGDAPETWQERLERLTGVDPTLCPVCGEGRLLLLEVLPRNTRDGAPSSARAPP